MSGEKITLWTRYSRLGASSRLRFFQYLPLLREAGFSPEISAFFDDGYLRRLYAGGGRSPFALLRAYRDRFRRMRECAADDAPALIEYELLPGLPYSAEARFLAGRRYFLNFDDAVHLRYGKLPFLRRKYPRLIAGAAGIIVANDLLMEEFGALNGNLLKLPTIPPETIAPATGQNPEKLTLIWTGTPVTFGYLKQRENAFKLAARHVDYQLLIVGGGAPLDGVACRCIPWSEAAEAEAFAQAHAGVMPLPDTPFARGKSAYKLICCLRAGIPGIASPVGENRQVIRHEVNGLLAESDEEWAEAIRRLADREFLAALSRGAAASAERYMLRPSAEKLAEFLRRRP